jgi:hypothetical protein
MKLLYCPHCGDIFSLSRRLKRCSCHRTTGKYISEFLARISSDAIPLGISNSSFEEALALRPDEGIGVEFTAFVIPRNCQSINQQQRECEDGTAHKGNFR